MGRNRIQIGGLVLILRTGLAYFHLCVVTWLVAVSIEMFGLLLREGHHSVHGVSLSRDAHLRSALHVFRAYVTQVVHFLQVCHVRDIWRLIHERMIARRLGQVAHLRVRKTDQAIDPLLGRLRQGDIFGRLLHDGASVRVDLAESNRVPAQGLLLIYLVHICIDLRLGCLAVDLSDRVKRLLLCNLVTQLVYLRAQRDLQYLTRFGFLLCHLRPASIPQRTVGILEGEGLGISRGRTYEVLIAIVPNLLQMTSLVGGDHSRKAAKEPVLNQFSNSPIPDFE